MKNIQRWGLGIARYALLPLLQLLAALGSAFIITAQFALAAAAHGAASPSFNDGISPTSVVSGNMPQAGFSTFYNRKFLENLKQMLVHLRLCTRMNMPVKSGQIFRNFMEPVLGANTIQQTEGTIGAGISITTNFEDYILGQWADFMNVADKALVTSITDDLVQLEKEMAYRLGLSMDDLVMANFDYLRTLDTKTANQDATVGPYAFTQAMIEQAPFSLEGQNVQPIAGGYYLGKIHPFFIGDMVALETGNNTIVDIMKHTKEGLMALKELPDAEDSAGVAYLELFGGRWLKSTNCTQTVNYLGSGNTAISTYIAGADAIVAVELDRPDKTKVGDGDWKKMTLWRGEYAKGQLADPAGVIGGGTSYNAILAFGVPPDITSRARVWKAVPQTS